MRPLLRSILLPPNADPKDAAVRTRTGKRCGAVGILANLCLFAAKLAVGWLSGSVAVTADAMNNLSDAGSAVVTLLGFRLAEIPADERHPFGHARFEYLAGLAVSAIIFLIGAELGKSALLRILHPEQVSLSGVLIGVLVLSIAVKLGLARLNRRLGDAIESTALQAAAADSRNDCISTAAVLGSALLSRWTGLPLDGWTGLAVAVFILGSSAFLAKDTISPLLGEGADPELQKAIARELRKEPEILGFHDLMVHDYGPGQRFASVHAEMDVRTDPLHSHSILDSVERRVLENHCVHLVIHYDPVITDDPEMNEMRREVELVLGSIDRRIHTHDFRLVRGEKRTDLIFDVTLPRELRGQESQIRKQLTTAINLRSGRPYLPVMTFESEAFNEAGLWEEE